ncbi:NAD(P)-binding protein [Amniculicola lignicola CBS 123094]|uniref:NAD(P)-binding protein n=1 Tax=Amniculicola lignicola CBS 123094 TaxID=1392246 RepID=A0A6A5WXE3_9PLEO|nr:NAD(P)-binding protein [Amniculicola lignicola CBS 123094]
MNTTNILVVALFNISGLVAVVTGGGTGIGLMITKALATAGARKHEPLILMWWSLPGDVASFDSLIRLAEIVKSDAGHSNILVANAGIMGPRPLKTAPTKPPPSIADLRAYALNTPMNDFTATYARNMGPDLRSQVNATSSIGGLSRLKGASFTYNSSKVAVTHMMKMLATSFAPYKIRCTVLAPGIFPSDLAGGTINDLGLGAGAAFHPTSVVVVGGGRLGTLVSTY